MLRISGRFNKPLWLAIAAQTTCLAIGLWIHHRYVVSSVNQASEQEARSELEALAAEAIAQFDRASLSGPRDETEAAARLEQITTTLADHSTDRLLWVDDKFRPLGPPHVDLEQSLWTAAPGDANAPGRQTRDQFNSRIFHGIMKLDGHKYLAVAHPLAAGKSYLLALRPSAEVAAGADLLAEPLAYAGAIVFVWTSIVMGFALYLILGQLHDQQGRKNEASDADALKRTEAMLRMREAVIFGLAKLTESRDPATGYHLERISLYSARLALAMRRLPQYRNRVTPDFIQLIGLSSILHDIGKVGVEDAVLLKPGSFNDDERQRMQKHAAIGGKCLQDIERRLGSSNFLQMAREIAFSHHEHWDGRGYPSGIAGEEIPLAARIVAITDVYEALSTRRIYKEALPHDECMAFVRDHAGTQFDPDLVDVFLSMEPQIRRIAQEFSNDEDQRTITSTREDADQSPMIPTHEEEEPTNGDESNGDLPAELLTSAHAGTLPTSLSDN